MTSPTPLPAHTPPLASGYQPGEPTWVEKHLAQSPYGADEAIRRALRLAVETQSARDLTLERIKHVMGIEMEIRSENYLQDRDGWYWLTPNWILAVGYMAYQPPSRHGPSFTMKFHYDQKRWARMPDRTELCANRQMDMAAAEKILLDNGFRMIYTPDNRNLSWSYYKEGMAAVRISFFDDIRPITNKKACIRQIRISIGKE